MIEGIGISRLKTLEPPLLLQPSASQEIPDRFHASLANSQDTIVENKSKIAITRHDVHSFSNFQVGRRIDRNDGVFRR